ncbi:MAG: energy transducer TonB [Sphingobacteriaceae bacterium]
MQYQEENNYPKAFAFSAILMAILLLISYFVIIGMPAQQEVGTGGIVVNYGTSENGLGDDFMSIDEPSVDPNANGAMPDNVSKTASKDPSAESSNKTVVTQDAEDAPSVSTKEKNNTQTPATATDVKTSKPVVNQNALYTGKKNNGTGKGDGTTGTPGNQGSKNGDPLSPNYGEGGSGFGGVSLSLANRRFVSIPRIEDDGQSSGRIAVEIRVDKTGLVVYARAGAKGTTLSDINLWRKCEMAVNGARLNQLESAPDVQIGVVIFNFKVQ